MIFASLAEHCFFKTRDLMLNSFIEKKYLLLFVFGAVNFATSLAQQDVKIDSLLNIIQKETNDTNKVNALNSLSIQYLKKDDFAEAKKYATEAMNLAEKKDFKKGISDAYNNLGNSYKRQGADYYYTGNYPEALKNYFEALRIYEKNKAKKGIADIYRNTGLVYWVQGNYSDALIDHLASLKILEEIKDSSAMAVAYNDIGNVYENQGNPREALENYNASLKIYEVRGKKELMINRYFNIGFLYDNQGNFSEALKNFSAALAISEEIGSKEGIAACYSNIGDLYYHESKTIVDKRQRDQLLNRSLGYYLNSLKGYKEVEEMEGLAACYNGLGRVYLDLKDFSKARKFLNDGLSLFKKVEHKESLEEYYQLPIEYIKENFLLLVKLDSATGNWKGAYRNYQSYIFYRDSLVNEENTGKILKTQMEYDFGKKEDSLKFKQQLNEEKLKQQTLQTKEQKIIKNYVLAGFIFLAILVFLIYKNYRARQKLKLQELRNKIASDLHDDIGSTLSSISIFSQMAQQQSKEAIPLLETIGENSQKMLDAMLILFGPLTPKMISLKK